ncbi:MAG: hypothetical protein EPO43_13420 [Rugosibacter sp.]|nr:MAG: hypothetical protein EPO43_13420 [Rugosibacter sp.]
MTPTFVPETFERVMGCTAAELLSWLPRALPSATLSIDTAASVCTAAVSGEALRLDWEHLASTRIALLNIPRLSVRFIYTGLPRMSAARCKSDLTSKRIVAAAK